MSTEVHAVTPRVRLDRERVLRTAIALADEAGIDGVSMRAIAKLLDVVPMALYKHVAGKGDLLDGMIDIVVAEIGAESRPVSAGRPLCVSGSCGPGRSCGGTAGLRRHSSRGPHPPPRSSLTSTR